MDTYHFGFIIEQTLGHITHARNLQRLVPEDSTVKPQWGFPAWETSGWSARAPVYRSNWALRAGLRARSELGKIQKKFRQDGPARRSAHPDALFFHTEITALLALDWLRRVPSVVSLDATPLQYDRLGEFYDHPTRPVWMERIKMNMYRETFHLASSIVTWSAWAKHGLVEEYQVPEEKITVIPPGVDPGLWARPAPRGLHNSPIKILFVGGNLERKGGLLLLEVFRCLRDYTTRPLELHLVTRDSIPAEEGVFVHHGLQPNSSELIRLYHESDIFCLPTYGDCLPMVLSEAGAAGLPVVSTQIAGIPEIVLDGKTGFLVAPGSREELQRALMTLISSPGLRLAQGQEAIQQIRRHFDARRNAARLLDLMKEQAEYSRQPREGK